MNDVHEHLFKLVFNETDVDTSKINRDNSKIIRPNEVKSYLIKRQ